MAITMYCNVIKCNSNDNKNAFFIFIGLLMYITRDNPEFPPSISFSLIHLSENLDHISTFS